MKRSKVGALATPRPASLYGLICRSALRHLDSKFQPIAQPLQD